MRREGGRERERERKGGKKEEGRKEETLCKHGPSLDLYLKRSNKIIKGLKSRFCQPA